MTKSSGLYHIFRTIRNDLKAADIGAPELEARILIEYVTGLNRDLIILDPERPILDEDKAKILELTNQRIQTRIPIAYLTGYKEFYGRSFFVAQDVLIPRPDSETLIEAIIAKRDDILATKFNCLDLGTGSGCLLLTLAAEIAGLNGIGVDISKEAVNIASKNARNLQLESRTQFLKSNWDDEIQTGKTFNLIISNPPYIPYSDIDTLEPDVKEHEPLNALFGEDDGLSAYRQLPKRIFSRLEQNGHCFIEIGAGQHNDVTALFENNGLYLKEKYKDLGGHIRILEFSKVEQS